MRKSKFKILSDGRIPMVRMTSDVWELVYPGEPKSLWNDISSPDNAFQFVSDALVWYDGKIKNLSFEQEFIMATIDEKYIKWMGEYNRADYGEWSIVEYIEDVGEEQLYNAMMNNQYQNGIEIMSLQVVLAFKQEVTRGITNIKLDQNSIQETEDLIKKLYPGHEIYVPGYVLRTQQMHDELEQVMMDGKTFFDHHVRVRRLCYETQEFKNEKIGITVMYIPFVINRKINKIVFTKQDLIEIEDYGKFLAYNSDVYYANYLSKGEFAKKFGINFRQYWDKTIVQNICKNIGNDAAIIIESPIPAIDVLRAEQITINSIAEECRNRNADISIVNEAN